VFLLPRRMARLKHSFGDRRAERLRRAIEARGSQYLPESEIGETRHVPLNSSALAAFLVLKRHSDGKGRVFSTSSPRRWFEPAVKAAGVLLFAWHSYDTRLRAD